MKFSFYEVYTNALRAFTGMGFPYGADEDAAYIIAWLELNKLNGIKLLANSINQIDNKYNGGIIIQNDETEIDFNKSSTLMKGPGIIEYYQSKLSHKKNIKIIINNCVDPLFLLPLLYKITPSAKFSNLSYLNSKNEEVVCFCRKDCVQIGFQSSDIILKKNQVKILMSNEFNILSLEKVNQEITTNSIQKNLAKSLNPNIREWKIIEKIAFRTFVPESEESRLKGAGGGNDND